MAEDEDTMLTDNCGCKLLKCLLTTTYFFFCGTLSKTVECGRNLCFHCKILRLYTHNTISREMISLLDSRQND